MASMETLSPASTGRKTDNASEKSGAKNENDIDLEALAAEVFELLKRESRLERERSGRR